MTTLARGKWFLGNPLPRSVASHTTIAMRSSDMSASVSSVMSMSDTSGVRTSMVLSLSFPSHSGNRWPIIFAVPAV